jgi:hypothetical protein
VIAPVASDSSRAQLDLRFRELELRPPKGLVGKYDTFKLHVVEAREINAPPEVKAVHWVLLTSLPVTSVEQAHEILTYYSYRWLIERFHYVLKSGCQLENSQLRERASLERLLAMYSIVASRLLLLTYQARQTPDAPCTTMLSEVELRVLYVLIHKHDRLPKVCPTLRQAVHWIGQLGGFSGRKRDDAPGVKVLWRGWMRLQDATTLFTALYYKKDVGSV